MDIIKLFNEKLAELGEDTVCQTLDLPRQMVRQFANGKKRPSYVTCQRILDNWTNGNVDKPVSDGSLMQVEKDQHGVSISYCPPEWGSKKAQWEGRDVCLCLPVYQPVHGDCFFSFMAIAMKYKQGIRLQYRGNDSMITRSRNHLAKRFLDTGATWSIWFDSDMIFPFGDSGVYMTITNMRHIAEKYLAVNTIERLISHKRTVVGGCYWDRRGGGKLIAGGGSAILNPIPSDTLHPVGFVGTGCLAVHRQVFLDIAEKFPETMSPDSLGNECGFFTNIQTPHRMMGEDESFAKRATDAGHPSYLDLGIICGHVGTTIHGIPVHGSKI